MNTYSMNLETNFRLLRLANWSCIVYAGFGLFGFAVLAGFWPPPAQHLNAEQIGQYFQDNNMSIRTGMVFMAIGAPFYFVWSAVLSQIIRHGIEGPVGVLSTTELLGGLLTALVTLMPATIWLTASLRPETRSIDEIHLLYDFGWIFFDITFVCSWLQSVAMGLAIHLDKRETPLFPSWSGFVCYLVAASYLPLSLMPFLPDSPFAWHGLISFWVVFVMFFIMIAMLFPLAFNALKRLEQEVSEKGLD